MSRSIIKIGRKPGFHFKEDKNRFYKKPKNKWATKRGKQLKELASQAENMFDKEAKAAGFEVHHRGWPDRLIYAKGKTYFIEIKLRKAKISGHQKRLHQALKRIGIEVLIFRINPKKENAALLLRQEIYNLLAANMNRRVS